MGNLTDSFFDRRQVSPGYAPRPSLSGLHSAWSDLARDSRGVAGVCAPAFVERLHTGRGDIKAHDRHTAECRRGMRPGLR